MHLLLCVWALFNPLSGGRAHASEVEDSRLLWELSELSPQNEGRGIVVILNDRDFGAKTSKLTIEAGYKLILITNVLRNYPRYHLRIQGHSATRTKIVANKLVQFGMENRRVEIVKPEQPENGETARRVEIVITSQRWISSALRKPFQKELPRLSGYVKNETACAARPPEDFTKIRNILYLTASGRYSDNLSYKLSGRGFYDAVFGQNSRYPAPVKKDMESEAVLREAYADISLGNTDFRLGRQVIVWGEAVGIFVADVVNPRDLREFILPDFDFIRTPVWAAQVEQTQGDLHLQAIWIPILEFNKIGLAGSEFAPSLPLPPRTPAVVYGTRQPPNSLENGELGARASYLLGGWDMAAFHFHGWDHFPALPRTIDSASVYRFTPTHGRLPVTGATFSKEIRNTIFKGEMIYSHGKQISVLDNNDPDGLVKKNTIDYMIGADRTIKKIDFNVQFIQRRVLNYGRSPLFQERPVSNSGSLWLKTGFWGNRLEPEILFLSDLQRKDSLLRPKINFSFLGSCQIRAGMDIFEGEPDGLFGQFRDKDRIYGEFRYNF